MGTKYRNRYYHCTDMCRAKTDRTTRSASISLASQQFARSRRKGGCKGAGGDSPVAVVTRSRDRL